MSRNGTDGMLSEKSCGHLKFLCCKLHNHHSPLYEKKHCFAKILLNTNMGWFRGSSEKSQGYVVEAHAIAIPVVDVEPSAPLPPPSNPQYRQSSPIIRHQLRLSIKSPRYPAFLTECPYCHVQNSTTRTRTAPALLTLLACIAISLLFWPICWL